MTEKRRATTFRTSKGTIVSVEYPDIYIEPGFVLPKDVTSPAEMGEALREEVSTDFTFEKLLKLSVDSFFYAYEVDLDGYYFSVPASKHWSIVSSSTDIIKTIGPYAGYLTCPKTARAVTVSSKRPHRYPTLMCQAIIPTLVYPAPFYPQGIWLGFEDGHVAGTGLIGFRFSASPADPPNVWIGSMPDSDKVVITVPADYQTALHVYTIKLSRSMISFYIDKTPVAFGLITPNSKFTAILGPPYALLSTQCPVSPSLPIFIEAIGHGTCAGLCEGVELKFQISPLMVRVTDGDPNPPMVFRLYDAGTNDLFTSLTIAAGSETSHPFPIHGFQQKTINFRASEQGTLSIEVLEQTDNWREYDTMGITQDTVKSYSIEGEAVLARVVYTPNTYPCTISEAEVVLR